jgi:hypothetical protein
MYKLLIIEDDKEKIRRLLAFHAEEDVVLKESFQAGVSELKKNHTAYDFLILDMTIPLWEKGNNDLGGNYEQFGGEKVLREMNRRKLHLPTILFTMFDVFPTQSGNLTFTEINAKFKEDFGKFFLGSILFTTDDDTWQNDMKELMNKPE